MSSSNHSGHTALDVEAQASPSMKAELDTVHQNTQKQEVDDERIQDTEKQQTKLSAFQEKMAPLMLFVVSMAQFIDISKSFFHISSSCFSSSS
jgi:hypothetical protein